MKVIALKLSRRDLRNRRVRKMLDALWRQGCMIRLASGVLVLATVGCGASNPAAPSAEHGAVIEQRDVETFARHGRPVSLSDNSVAYLCMTQVREYVLANGTRHFERDWYVQRTNCPATPIE